MRLRRPVNFLSATSLATAAFLLFAVAGCSQTEQPDADEKGQPDAPASQADEPATEQTTAKKVSAEQSVFNSRDRWNVYYIQGKRVGYDRITITDEVRAGEKVMLIEQLTHLAIKRFGQTTEQETNLRSVETPSSGLISFQCEMRQAAMPIKSEGKVAGDKLQIATTAGGKTTVDSIDWSPDFKGFLGVEQSLLDKPMQPGEKRTIRTLMAMMNQVATVELAAKQRERVQLLSGTYELMRIEAAVKLPGGQALHQTIWCDRAGNGLKSVLKEMGLETYRATKAQALEKTEATDLGWGVAVDVEGTISDPHEAKQMTYRVRLKGGDPASVFVSGASQEIASLDAKTADITVYALRPGVERAAGDFGENDKPTSADMQPNSYIQSDNAKVIALAKQAVGDENDPWKTAVKLENFVGEHITEKGLSEAFATAADVAENPVGDCTEHAVLLAALARARGIPARVAMGLVFMPNAADAPGGRFCYHMWTEVFIDGCWLPLDATRAKGGIGAGHLKLAHGSLEGSSALVSFLPVAQVLGRLKIESREGKKGTGSEP